MARTKSSSSAKSEELKRINARLKAENAQLKTQLAKKSVPHTRSWFSRIWRPVVIALSVAFATAILVVANILFWAGSTVVSTEKYVETTREIIEDPVVQQGVADYTTAKLFENVDVSAVIQDALPPRADFLAEPLASQVQNVTNQALQKILASSTFQTTYLDINQRAHERFITAIKTTDGDGTINLQDVYNQLSQNLKDTKLSFLAGKSLPENIGTIQVIDAPWVPTVRNVINGMDWLKPVALALVFLFSALAIWLSGARRRMVIKVGMIFSVSMFLLLITLRLGSAAIVSSADSAYQPAVEHVVHIVLNSLVIQARVVLLLGLLIAFVAWIGGSTKRATFTRERVSILLSGKIHESIFGNHESRFTDWVGRHKLVLQWGAITLIATIMLFVQLSPVLVVAYGFVMLLSYLVLEVVAKPQLKK